MARTDRRRRHRARQQHARRRARRDRAAVSRAARRRPPAISTSDLTLYTLPEVPRTEFGRRQVSRYSSIDDLWDRRYDGLIVTGTEPQADGPDGRAVLGQPDHGCWSGRSAHVFDHPLVPRRARRHSAHRRHRSAAARRQAVRRVRVRPRLRTIRSPPPRRPAADAALALERDSGGGAARVRLSRADAVRRTRASTRS